MDDRRAYRAAVTPGNRAPGRPPRVRLATMDADTSIDALPYVDISPDAFARFARWIGGQPPADRARVLLTAVLASLENESPRDKAGTVAVLALRLSRLRPRADVAHEDGQGFSLDELFSLLKLARCGLNGTPPAAPSPPHTEP